MSSTLVPSATCSLNMSDVISDKMYVSKMLVDGWTCFLLYNMKDPTAFELNFTQLNPFQDVFLVPIYAPNFIPVVPQ